MARRHLNDEASEGDKVVGLPIDGIAELSYEGDRSHSVRQVYQCAVKEGEMVSEMPAPTANLQR